jgi:hypothetical protein
MRNAPCEEAVKLRLALDLEDLRGFAADGQWLVERTFDISPTISMLEQHFERAAPGVAMRSR